MPQRKAQPHNCPAGRGLGTRLRLWAAFLNSAPGCRAHREGDERTSPPSVDFREPLGGAEEGREPQAFLYQHNSRAAVRAQCGLLGPGPADPGGRGGSWGLQGFLRCPVRLAFGARSHGADGVWARPPRSPRKA